MIDPRRLLGLLSGAVVSESAMVALMQGMALALCAVALMMALDELRQANVLARWFGAPPPVPLLPVGRGEPELLEHKDGD